MGKKPSRPGYIAISRAIFDHPLFQTRRPFSRLEAWEWLINAAAWAPKARRNKFGAVHTERGQLAVTRRELGAVWRWPKTNVDRFLRKLAAEQMILLGEALNGPKNGPEMSPTIGYPMTMVTICNYEKFQRASRRSEAQQPDQKAGQKQETFPGFVEAADAQPFNHTNQSESRILSPEMAKRMPRDKKPGHGDRSRKDGGQWVWWDHLTPEWTIYAKDFKDVTGAEKLPESRKGGRGNWFRWLGETPKQASRQG